MTVNGGRWIQRAHTQRGARRDFKSYGTFTATTTAPLGIPTDTTAAKAYFTVNNGGSLERPPTVASAFSSAVVPGSTLSLTKNSFGGTLYCTLPYVPQLTNNSSFGIVDISGGTLSQNVDIERAGQRHDRLPTGQQLDDRRGDAAHVESGHRDWTCNNGSGNGGVSVIVNGSLAINGAAWIQRALYTTRGQTGISSATGR